MEGHLMTRKHIGALFALVLAVVVQPAAVAGDKGTPPSNSKEAPSLAPTPPLGWNSWNTFGKLEINERIVKEVIDAMVDGGLRDAGYRYVVIDGGWRDTRLGLRGELLPHPVKFPHGIKSLADYAHSKGLKLGLHTVPGTHDCIGDPVGGFGREAVHIQQFVDWGIDFVKLDKCRFEGGWTDERVRDVYTKWSKLLAEQSQSTILFSASAYQPYDWYPQVCQMARTTEDISAKVAGMSGCEAVFDDPIPMEINKWGMLTIMEIAEINDKSASLAGNGFWNDPDMLVTGDQGLSHEEQKSHFALWCIMSAPLMLGNDPRHMSQDERDIILNPEAIAIDQDPTEQGRRLKKLGQLEIWAKHLCDGSIAVLLLNRNKTSPGMISLDLESIGLPSNVQVRDVYAKQDLAAAAGTIAIEVAPRSSRFLKLSK
jgi:alpha-galactosidase